MSENSKEPENAPCQPPNAQPKCELAAPATREDAAKWLIEHRERLRARIVRAARRAGAATDIDDMLSSVFRRVDLAFLRGCVRAQTEREFWAFATVIIHNMAFNRLRKADHERAFLSRECPRIGARFEQCHTNDEAAALVHEILMSLNSDLDREIVWGRLQGRSGPEIAWAMGVTESVVRSRWAGIRRSLA